MKDKKKMRLVIAFAVLVLGGLVYYRLSNKPTLGHYVYLENRNQYSAVAHSCEDCSEIKGGLRRQKTEVFIWNINQYSGLSYCSKCLNCDMLIEYSQKYKCPFSN